MRPNVALLSVLTVVCAACAGGPKTQPTEHENAQEASARTTKPTGHDGFSIPESASPALRKPSERNSFTIPDSDEPGSESPDHDGFGIGRGPCADPGRLPAAVEDPLILGSWNIKWFGQSKPDKYDFVTMADFIEECHVVAIQELKAPHHQAVLDALLAELTNRGHNYDFKFSASTGYKNNSDDAKNDYEEMYAFIWDANSVKLKGAPSLVASPAINNGTYRQVPYVADFEVNGANGFDFRLLTTHTVYNKAINAVRKGEIQAIEEWITTMPSDGEENLIALGDFNANPSSQPRHFEGIIETNDLYRILWYESTSESEASVRTTVPTKDTSNNPTYFNLPIYDHVLISSATSAALPADPMTQGGNHFGVWDFDNDPWWKQNGWTRSNIISAVSDHRPIWFKMEFLAEDND